MLAIGLGKRDGATQIHKLGVPGMLKVLPAVMKFLVANTKFALGLAILENVEDMPAEIVALEPEEILEAEPKLLDRARGLMGRLPFDQIDVLVVGELGKNYSGSGMDPNVIGRLMVETMPDLPRPVVTRLAVLDASEETHGNIVGVGFADLTTELLVSKVDPEPFRINVLTSCCLERARIPITLPTDRDVLAAALDTCWRIDPLEARVVIIPNTLELTTLWVSPALEAEVARPPPPGPRDRIPPDALLRRGDPRPGVDVPRERPGAEGRRGLLGSLRIFLGSLRDLGRSVLFRDRPHFLDTSESRARPRRNLGPSSTLRPGGSPRSRSRAAWTASRPRSSLRYSTKADSAP